MTDEQIKRMIVENRGNEEDLFADIKELTKKAEVRGQIEAYRNIPDYRQTIMDTDEITLEKWLWKEIDKLEAELQESEGEG